MSQIEYLSFRNNRVESQITKITTQSILGKTMKCIKSKTWLKVPFKLDCRRFIHGMINHNV